MVSPSHGAPVSTVTLLLSCPDQRGVVATVAAFVADHGGNILHADQHLDSFGVGTGPVFFQRVEFALDGFGLTRDEIPGAFAPIAERFAMDVRICFSDERERVALLASKQPHCLADLLVRWSSGELPCDVVVVVANHADHAALCAGLGVPFVHLPVVEGRQAEQEAQVLDVLVDA